MVWTRRSTSRVLHRKRVGFEKSFFLFNSTIYLFIYLPKINFVDLNFRFGRALCFARSDGLYDFSPRRRFELEGARIAFRLSLQPYGAITENTEGNCVLFQFISLR